MIHFLGYNTNNIGDDLQTHVLKTLLQKQTHYGADIDRSNIQQELPFGSTLFFNGMLPAKDIPVASVNVVYLAVSCVYFGEEFTEDVIQHFMINSPIGCRDLATLQKMQSHNIPAVFTGCPTILYSAPTTTLSGPLYIDVPHPEQTTNYITPTESRSERLSFLLQQYANCSEVHSSRIHCILPCMGLQKPIQFYDSLVTTARHRLTVLSDRVRQGKRICKHSTKQQQDSTRYAINKILSAKNYPLHLKW